MTMKPAKAYLMFESRDVYSHKFEEANIEAHYTWELQQRIGKIPDVELQEFQHEVAKFTVAWQIRYREHATAGMGAYKASMICYPMSNFVLQPTAVPTTEWEIIEEACSKGNELFFELNPSYSPDHPEWVQQPAGFWRTQGRQLQTQQQFIQIEESPVHNLDTCGDEEDPFQNE